MAAFPESAKAVVIGAGIVGNSLVHHLARLGWRDLVLLDKGPLPNPGGSTGHASNFIFPVDHSKEITALTRDSVDQYVELGVYTVSGGIEVARSPERFQELNRRLTSSISWGEPSELLTPAQVKELVPYVNEEIILGGFHTPGVGVVDSVGAGTRMREAAQALGALTVSPSTEVTGIDVENGRVRRVHTDKGPIEAEYVFVCCGVWSPRIARMAGAAIPLTPAVHQMITVGPIPLLEQTHAEIAFPIVRDMDALMYERQYGGDMEVGSYAHRPILMAPDDIPSLEESELSPTELPFTSEDFDGADGARARADPRDPERRGRRDPLRDQRPALADPGRAAGPGRDARGEEPLVGGRRLDQGRTGRRPRGGRVGRRGRLRDRRARLRHRALSPASARRAPRRRAHVRGLQQDLRDRPSRGAVGEQPERPRQPVPRARAGARAVFFETAGWERPWWYESNAVLLEEYGDRVMPREAEWDSRWWSPIVNAEHLAMRDRVAMIDLTAFHILDVTGSGALEALQQIALAELDVEPGRVVYTPVLDHNGGFKADLTIMRLGPELFRVVTGAAHGMADRKWFADRLPQDGSAQLTDVTEDWCTVGVWGPRARDLVASVTSDDVSHAGFPFARCRELELGGTRALASRISYVGELGWEIYAPMADGAALWDVLWEAGQPLGVVPAGIGVYGTTGRIEKGYRLYGAELDPEHDVAEAGLTRPTVKEHDFVGKDAYLRQLEEEPAARLCTLTVDDPTSSSGVKRYMLGGEPILTAGGERIVDRKGRPSYVTSAGSGPSVGKHLLLAYLPPDHAVEGEQLLVQYMGERYPVTVAVAGSRPLFDPENTRIRS